MSKIRRSAGATLIGLLACLAACTSPPASETADPNANSGAVAEASSAEVSPLPGVRFRYFDVNGIHMRIAEQGEGPLVIFVHGFPESWYSWRHQLPAVADVGYHAVAPDMRGYGATTAPAEISDYDITHLCGDLTALVSALGEQQAVLVGHDWGAVAGWQCALLEPEVFRAVVNMSVPYRGRAERSPVETWHERFGDDFFYILYFQELAENGTGIAEAEFDADPRAILSRLYASRDTPRKPPEVTDPLRAAGGWSARLGQPTELPPWLSAADLDYYVAEFTRAGFRGGINYYRNFHRNWETTPQLAGAQVLQPSLFIAGELDGVIGGADQEQLETGMAALIPDLRGVHLIAGSGHWVQQESPEEVNSLLVAFLTSLD